MFSSTPVPVVLLGSEDGVDEVTRALGFTVVVSGDAKDFADVVFVVGVGDVFDTLGEAVMTGGFDA